MSWYVAAAIAATVFGANMVVLKLLAETGTPNSVVLFGLYLVGATVFLFHVRVEGRGLPSGFAVAGIVLAGLLSYTGFRFQLMAIVGAPNPGYATAIISTMVVVSTALWWIVRRNPISPQTGIGVVLCLAGVLTIALANRPTAPLKQSEATRTSTDVRD